MPPSPFTGDFPGVYTSWHLSYVLDPFSKTWALFFFLGYTGLLLLFYQSRKGSFSERERRGGADLTAATRIFSPLTVPRLYVTIGRYVYLFKRLAGLSARRSYRFEHIVTDSSGEVVAKSGHPVFKLQNQNY